MITILPAVILLSAGCCSVQRSAHEYTPPMPDVSQADGHIRASAPLAALPHAVVYRTDGDYDNRVMVTLDASRTQLVSYPAPTDVSPASAPYVMSGGWLLDRRGGIGFNSAFLEWTYDEYSRLPQAPSPAEIISRIIPGARVTAVRQLLMTVNEALADTAAINTWLTTSSVTENFVNT